jgi:hypothetical protein
MVFIWNPESYDCCTEFDAILISLNMIQGPKILLSPELTGGCSDFRNLDPNFFKNYFTIFFFWQDVEEACLFFSKSGLKPRTIIIN